eukprot:6849748-Prorocentrum_lima.AAC.1
MTSSLVGSEMCIRDSSSKLWVEGGNGCLPLACYQGSVMGWKWLETQQPPVSYTHLTLPTICSV